MDAINMRMPEDEAITDKIRAALEEDPDILYPAEIAVSYRPGTVTLRGTVSSLQQRHAAVETAKRSATHAVVEDELWVDFQDRWEDDETRGRVLQALMSDPAVPAGRIDVHVADGWLTLKGEVKHQRDSDAAFAAASGVPGVGGVTNEIKVVTAGLDGGVARNRSAVTGATTRGRPFGH